MIIGSFCLIIIVLFQVAGGITATSLRLTLLPNSKRCLSMEIPDKTLVTGIISSNVSMTSPADVPKQGPITTFIIDDKLGGKYYHNTNVRVEPSNFSFRIHGATREYQLCVSTDHYSSYSSKAANDILLEVNLNEDLFDVSAANDSSLLPEEAELIHMESVMKHIVQELDQIQFTERDLRDTNESTNDRVKYLGIFSFILLNGCAVGQFFFMRRYLKSKKII